MVEIFKPGKNFEKPISNFENYFTHIFIHFLLRFM